MNRQTPNIHPMCLLELLGRQFPLESFFDAIFVSHHPFPEGNRFGQFVDDESIIEHAAIGFLALRKPQHPALLVAHPNK